MFGSSIDFINAHSALFSALAVAVADFLIGVLSDGKSSNIIQAIINLFRPKPPAGPSSAA